MNKLGDSNVDWDLKLNEVKQKKYNYQEELTNKLDTYPDAFSYITILEIVLWKTNRYPAISKGLIDHINELRKNYSEETAKELLRELLEAKGFDLPMASTVLRFACPNELQIIDQRAFRIIMGEELKTLYNVDKKIYLYFKYIQELENICSTYNIDFKTCDRILYQLDKIVNKDFSIKNYGKREIIL